MQMTFLHELTLHDNEIYKQHIRLHKNNVNNENNISKSGYEETVT